MKFSGYHDTNGGKLVHIPHTLEIGLLIVAHSDIMEPDTQLRSKLAGTETSTTRPYDLGIQMTRLGRMELHVLSDT